MARKKPYTKRLMFLDIFLTLLTGGGWLLVRIPWEYYMRNSS